MWELDHKESWVPKNWCFQTEVLEKTLESPLDSKKIKPVNPKENQPWIFIGRTDAEADTTILWPPDVKSWLTRKDTDAKNDWGQEEKRLLLLENYHHYYFATIQFSSVQFSRSVVSNSLRPHESQHARPPCPSPTPRLYPNSCPSSRWCHPAVSSSAVPFSSCPQSLPASGSFPVSQLFSSGDQSIGVSASTSVLPMDTQGWSPLGWTGWISLQSKGLSRVFSNTTVQKH